MIDLGVVMTDLDGQEVAEGGEARLFLRIDPAHPERLDQGAAAVNGFSIERWRTLETVSQSQAVDAWLAFHERLAEGKTVLFCAYNAWFDIAFVDHLFRSVGRSWRSLFHYHVIDIPSMLWGLGLTHLGGDELCRLIGVEPETTDPLEHTGISGAVSNVEVYRALLALRQRQGAPRL